jgi:hypothetical protein
MTDTKRRFPSYNRRKFDFSSWIIIYLAIAVFVFLFVTKKNFLTFNNIHSILFNVSFSQTPPAKPGACFCEPLKAVDFGTA